MIKKIKEMYWEIQKHPVYLSLITGIVSGVVGGIISGIIVSFILNKFIK